MNICLIYSICYNIDHGIYIDVVIRLNQEYAYAIAQGIIYQNLKFNPNLLFKKVIFGQRKLNW